MFPIKDDSCSFFFDLGLLPNSQISTRLLEIERSTAVGCFHMSGETGKASGRSPDVWIWVIWVQAKGLFVYPNPLSPRHFCFILLSYPVHLWHIKGLKDSPASLKQNLCFTYSVMNCWPSVESSSSRHSFMTAQTHSTYLGHSQGICRGNPP